MTKMKKCISVFGSLSCAIGMDLEQAEFFEIRIYFK